MEKTIARNPAKADSALLRLLDRGIEDVRAERTMPHDEAVQAIRRIRDARRNEIGAGREADEK